MCVCVSVNGRALPSAHFLCLHWIIFANKQHEDNNKKKKIENVDGMGKNGLCAERKAIM